MPDDRLSLNVTLPGGYQKRWGPDEPDGADIPGDLTITDTIPGGHATLSTSLLRRIDVQHPDEQLFSDVHCYGPGGRTAWRGRLQQLPRTHGDGYGVSPGAVGWSAHLRDDPSFREIYVDRAYSSWRDPSGSRRAVLANTPVAMGAISTFPNTLGTPIFCLNYTGGWATASGMRAEAWYEAPPGVTAAIVTADWSTNTNIGTGAGNWTFQVHSSDDDGASFPESGADQLTGAAPSGVLSFAAATPRRYLLAQLAFTTGPAGSDGSPFDFYLSSVAVYGGHGLSARGSAAPYGYLASDVVADVVSRAAPMLTYSTGAGGSIEATSFVIKHLVYRDPVTAEDAISDVNKYHLYDWGVYDDREFFFRQPDPDRLLWEARLSDGAHLDADGDTGEQVINGVFVTYTDPAGVTRTVGPPGGMFDDTDSLLEDTSSSNPVNAAGIPRKWVQLTLSFPALLSDAVQIGYVYLQERSLAGRRGRVTLTGTATHPTEGKVPCWRVRAGDWITLKDLNGATVPRKIISKSYTHGSRQVTLDLDNTPNALDAILARVGIHAGIATGGGF